MSTSKTVILRSSDGHDFEVDLAVARQSPTIKRTMEHDSTADNVIPLPYIAGDVLAKVIEYCKKHVESPEDGNTEEELKTWDAEFVRVAPAELYYLLVTAAYLDIVNLRDLIIQTGASMMVGKTVEGFEEIRKMFNKVLNYFYATPSGSP